MSAGARRMLSRLPRRSRSLASSEVVVPDRDEDVLERGPARVVRVHVAGDDGADAGVVGEVAQERVPAGVAALERPLQLDVELLRAEDAGEPRPPRSGRGRRARLGRSRRGR